MTSPSDLSVGPNSFSPFEDSVIGRSSSGVSFDRSFDGRDSLHSRIDQLRASVLQTAGAVNVSPQQHRKAVDALSRGQQLIRSPSVNVLTDFRPIREQQSPYDDSIAKGDIEKKIQVFCDHERTAESLKQVSSVLDMLDAFKGFRELPAKVGEVAGNIFDGKPIVFDSKKPVTINETQELGRGGQGSVYKGSFLGKDCAVKCVEVNHASERFQFTKECETMAKLNHPRIISPLAATENKLYIPLAKGDLKKAWESRASENKLTASQFRGYLQQIAEGMSYLHQHGFVHRDLKAENCLVTLDGNILIADLGLVDTVENIIHGSDSQSGKGSQLYMAIETFNTSMAEKENCAKRDVWSLGIMIWRFLSNENQKHPCVVEMSGQFPVFLGMQAKMEAGGFAEGELESQLDHAKVADYDPEGCVVELMKACLRFDPSERISMADIQSVLEVASNSSVGAKEKLSKILEGVARDAVIAKTRRENLACSSVTSTGGSNSSDIEEENDDDDPKFIALMLRELNG